MEAGSSRLACFLIVALALGWSAAAQDVEPTLQVPEKFKVDIQTAARMRPQLFAASAPVPEEYAIGRLVFERLVSQAQAPSGIQLAWELRFVDDGLLNAYSSPDGTVYVESGLAQLAGQSAGLWAAILSHEIAHIARRDWARRYLYERSLRDSGATVVLGDPGLNADAWIDSRKASADMAQFCRRVELEADRESLMLMARAGFHPDFVPALHHLLHAQNASGTKVQSIYAMHPCWEERDRELEQAYSAASIEFEHDWPAWYASPGGNPPIVVFASEPTIQKVGSGWEIRIPMRCQNLAGAVEVVLRRGVDVGLSNQPSHPSRTAQEDEPRSLAADEVRQVTGCTSPRTTVIFSVDNSAPSRSAPWSDVYVLDAWGSVLARMELPRLKR